MGHWRVFLPFCLLATPVAAQEIAVPDDAMPQPPAVVAASFATPPRDAAGHYATPNRDLTAPESLWHLRVALNVAALGCRDADEGVTVATYNLLLARGRDALATAQEQMAMVYRQRHGAAAQARSDDAMTRLYNFFAQPTGHDGFCATAKAVLAETATIDPATLGHYAATALPRLEAPFLAFFAAWDGYRGALDRWQARRAGVTLASAPPAAPVAEEAQQMTVTLTPAALAAIRAGQIPGVTIAAPAAAPVLIASVR